MSLEQSIREWDRAVKDEAERLIKRGVPPFQAVITATERISAQRAIALLGPPETP